MRVTPSTVNLPSATSAPSRERDYEPLCPSLSVRFGVLPDRKLSLEDEPSFSADEVDLPELSLIDSSSSDDSLCPSCRSKIEQKSLQISTKHSLRLALLRLVGRTPAPARRADLDARLENDFSLAILNGGAPGRRSSYPPAVQRSRTPVPVTSTSALEAPFVEWRGGGLEDEDGGGMAWLARRRAQRKAASAERLVIDQLVDQHPTAPRLSRSATIASSQSSHLDEHELAQLEALAIIAQVNSKLGTPLTLATHAPSWR